MSLRQGLVFCLICIVFAFVAHLAGRPPTDRCALDGSRIDPLYQVTAQFPEEGEKSFSCILSALTYLERRDLQRRPRASGIVVIDEVRATPLAAEKAFYVRSSVVSVPSAGNDIHAFARIEDALEHAEAFQGQRLPNPFSKWQKE